MRNHMVTLRERFRHDAGLVEQVDTSAMPATLSGRVAKRSGLAEVYIVLYNNDGTNLIRWESLLRTVAQQAISRPTYRHEKDAKAALRSSVVKSNEAYISMFVYEEDILIPKTAQPPKDRFGNELINLRESAVSSQNIKQFVHVSGVYEYRSERLIRKSSAEFL